MCVCTEYLYIDIDIDAPAYLHVTYRIYAYAAHIFRSLLFGKLLYNSDDQQHYSMYFRRTFQIERAESINGRREQTSAHRTDEIWNKIIQELKLSLCAYIVFSHAVTKCSNFQSLSKLISFLLLFLAVNFAYVQASLFQAESGIEASFSDDNKFRF